MYQILKIILLLKKMVFIKRSKAYSSEAKRILKTLKLKPVKLNYSDIEKVNKVWGRFSFNKSYPWHRLYKSYHNQFNEFYIPTEAYFNYFENTLNPKKYSTFLQHKGVLKLFIPEKNRPRTVVSNINHSFFDDENNFITHEEAINKLIRTDEFIIKPSMESGGGKNVQKIIHHGIALSERKNKLLVLFKEYKKDFIIQKIINQHNEIAKYNPDTVNTIRLMSLNINNNVTILSAFLRIGAKGMHIDNLSAGGMFVGITNKGNLHSFALNRKWERLLESPGGIVFKNQKIPNYESIKKKIKEFHTKIPLASLIAWDITLDEAGNTIIVEINLDSGNPVSHQICNGPLFKERTTEVIDYVLNNPSQTRLTF